MILDYKIHKKLLPYSDKIKSKLVTYLSQFTGTTLTKHKLDLIDKVSKCFVINMVNSIKKIEQLFQLRWMRMFTPSQLSIMETTPVERLATLI